MFFSENAGAKTPRTLRPGSTCCLGLVHACRLGETVNQRPPLPYPLTKLLEQLTWFKVEDQLGTGSGIVAEMKRRIQILVGAVVGLMVAPAEAGLASFGFAPNRGPQRWGRPHGSHCANRPR